MKLITAAQADSPARTTPPGHADAPTLRIAAVQTKWHADAAEHLAVLDDGVRTAAEAGATLVINQELTLARYFCDELPTGDPQEHAEDFATGPTMTWAKKAAADNGVYVHASVFEKTDEGDDPRGYNTAFVVAPSGELVAKTRKLHIPVTAGYYEDRYFRQGPTTSPAPHEVAGVKLGLPTCWDQWFPELARAYGLAGADVLAYPTAIGSEPDHPEFDTQPAWQTMMVAHGITNGLFIVAANRYGNEGTNTFYGSSFISDPYGRVLARAGRDEDAVIVADLDLAARQDWLDLFPLNATRRPDVYGTLLAGATDITY